MDTLGDTRNSAADTPSLSEDLEIVRRHVQSAQARVQVQRKLIALLAARRLPLKDAKDMLRLFEATLRAHEDYLVEIEQMVGWSMRRQRTSSGRVGDRETAEHARYLRVS